MDNKTQHTEKSIELRSEKVRNIVGQIPSLLIRQGILIIGLALLILVGVSAFIPYKKTLPVNIKIYTVPKIEKVYAKYTGIMLTDSLPEKTKTNQVLRNIVHHNALYPVLSPNSGKLISNKSNNDSIQKNDLLFVVIPDNIKYSYGECEIDASQKNKIKKGLNVEISDNLGHQYNGKVTTIYPIPTKTEQLKVRISIDNFPATETVNQLKGKIILEETTFLRYFMTSLKI